MVKLTAIIHGSRDPEYLMDVERFFRRIGMDYVQLLGSEGLGIIPNSFPLFLERGSDYMRALNIAEYKVKPLLEYEAFVKGLRAMLPSVVVMHGVARGQMDTIGVLESLGFRPILLANEPNVRSISRCPGEAYALVLFRGVIFRRIREALSSRCPGTALRGPLSGEPWFPELLLKTLREAGLPIWP